MSRFLFKLAGFGIALFVIGSALPMLANAETASAWFRPGNPTLVKIVDLPAGSTPATGAINGNRDCRQQKIVTRPGSFVNDLGIPLGQSEQSTQSCVVDTKYGAVSTSGYLVRLGTLLGGKVKQANGADFPIIPVPNSDTALSWESNGYSDGTLRINFLHNFSQEITTSVFADKDGTAVHNLKPSAKPTLLKGPDGQPLNIDYSSIAFSKNGEWMVAYAPPHGPIRVNVKTLEVLRFDPTIAYSYSLPLSPQNAVTSDGRYVFLSSGNYSLFKIYDLLGCTPSTVPPLKACPSKDLRPFLLSQPYGLKGGAYIRFSDRNNITFYSSRVENNQVLFTQYALTAPGEALTKFGYLALGDSFASGEGTFAYKTGTDVKTPLNKCHLSPLSYPYLLGADLKLDTYQSVACAGAVMHDMDRYGYEEKDYNENIAQSEGKADKDLTGEILKDFLPGYRPQRDFITEYRPGVITVSVLGNDIGFAPIISKCVLTPTCYGASAERADKVNEINSKFKQLVDTFAGIKDQAPPGAKIYVLGYPKLVDKNGNCGNNVHANKQELEFFDKLVPYLNFVVERAAHNTGVGYVNVENALVGSRLCEAYSDQIAVNGLTAGNDNFLNIGPVGKESYHPNVIGHQLFRDEILRGTKNFTKSTLLTNLTTLPDPTILDGAELIGDPVFLSKTHAYNRLIYGEGLTPDIVYEDQFIDTSLDGLKPRSKVDPWLRSDPVQLAGTVADENGSASLAFRIPANTPVGLHTIHIYAVSLAGEPLDIYKDVYVAVSENDYDGDGVLNAQEKCLVVEAANVDYDKDGVDDACDGQITEPPSDTAPPAVTGTPDRAPNAGGWYNGDVTINWSANDPEPSSGAPNTPAATLANQEGTNTYTSGQSCDQAGNCAAGNLVLKIDKTPPEISFSVTPAPNAQGWNNSAVVVKFNCGDALSGVASCSETVTLSAGNGGHMVTGTTTDKAGNTTDVNAVIMIDSTKPEVSNIISPAANSSGWHNSNITVNPVCNDSFSGVFECSPQTVLTVEGANQTITSTAADKAGNSSDAVSHINIDKTAPVLGTPSWSVNPKASSAVSTFTVPGSDNLSGLAEAEYFLGDDPGQGNGAAMAIDNNGLSVAFGADFPTGVYKITIRAKDTAGNWSTNVSDYLVVYNPDGLRMTGKKTLLPSLSGGDILPGLVGADQKDKAKFGFNIRYDNHGQIHKNSDFQFSYEAGGNSLNLNANSVAWLTTMGSSNSTGIFQGTGTLAVDGKTSQVSFRVTGVDGELLGSTSSDHLTLQIFAMGDNPDTATPIYRINADVLRGNIRIRK